LAIILLGFAVIAELVAVQAVLFVWPPSDVPAHADAVVAFSGDHGERLATGLRLIRRHVASSLVLPHGNSAEWPPEARVLCTHPQSFEVFCPMPPAPFNTQAEAQTIATLARSHRWRRIVMVTSTFHVARARLLLQRCYHGSIYIAAAVPVRGRIQARVLWHEWRGLAWSLVVKRSC
jgi:uncharacterized SAM-binding protein YcdF (DUF218 family)